MRFLLTALPCFFDTAMPILISDDGKIINVRVGEKTLFPLLNSFVNSELFLILK